MLTFIAIESFPSWFTSSIASPGKPVARVSLITVHTALFTAVCTKKASRASYNPIHKSINILWIKHLLQLQEERNGYTYTKTLYFTVDGIIQIFFYFTLLKNVLYLYSSFAKPKINMHNFLLFITQIYLDNTFVLSILTYSLLYNSL